MQRTKTYCNSRSIVTLVWLDLKVAKLKGFIRAAASLKAAVIGQKALIAMKRRCIYWNANRKLLERQREPCNIHYGPNIVPMNQSRHF